MDGFDVRDFRTDHIYDRPTISTMREKLMKTVNTLATGISR